MANECFYTLHAVSKDEEALKRLFRIMRYEDSEYAIYRCFGADLVCSFIENDKHVYKIEGDVAWSCYHWFEGEEDFSNLANNGAHYVSLDLLCKKLGIGIELYSEEEGMCFQEHYLCNANGEVVVNDSVEWHNEYEDANGNKYDEPKEIGGFYDYCNFLLADEIYSAVNPVNVP